MPQTNPLGRYLRVQSDHVAPVRTIRPYREPTRLEWVLGTLGILLSTGLLFIVLAAVGALLRWLGW